MGQKNVIPITKSELTGLSLPVNSKLDKRILSETGTNIFLEAQSKKMGYTITKSETIYISEKYTLDSALKFLQILNWKTKKDPTEKQYAYLEKDTKKVIMYLDGGKDKSFIYFGELSTLSNSSANSETSRDRTPTSEIKKTTEKSPSPPIQTSTPGNIQYTFTTTNWNDGWTSIVESDWVKIKKENIQVLLHYPNSKEDKNDLQLESQTRSAWNLYVSNHYSGLQNFYVLNYSMDFEPANFASGVVKDPISNKLVFVVFFRKAKSGWIEVVAPDQQTFESTFGIQISQINHTFNNWTSLLKLAEYNRFAVAANDLYGIWKNDFSGITQYVSVYTGQSAGADTHTSRETYQFQGNNTYQWDLGVASGFTGNIKVQTVKSNGQFQMKGNWEIYLSDIEGKPKNYSIYFSCIKGTRILYINGTAFGRVQ